MRLLIVKEFFADLFNLFFAVAVETLLQSQLLNHADKPDVYSLQLQSL